MLTKLEIRKQIDCKKEEYGVINDKTLYVDIAILKGLYLALDGKKYITIPQWFDNITAYAKLIFKHKLNIKAGLPKEKIAGSLIKSLISICKKPESFLNNGIPVTNEEIAKLFVKIILSEYTEDMVINFDSTYSKALELLNNIDEREAGV